MPVEDKPSTHSFFHWFVQAGTIEEADTTPHHVPVIIIIMLPSPSPSSSYWFINMFLTCQLVRLECITITSIAHACHVLLNNLLKLNLLAFLPPLSLFTVCHGYRSRIFYIAICVINFCLMFRVVTNCLNPNLYP